MNKFLQRNKVYVRRDPTIIPRKLYVYCEGDVREHDYFLFFHGLSSNIEIIPVRDENGKSDPESLMEAAKFDFDGIGRSHAKWKIDEKQLDEIWFAIDTDQWNHSGKINKLRSFCHMRNGKKSYPIWNVAQSNPSFEIWLYYHQKRNKPLHEEVLYHKSFKEFVHCCFHSGFDSVRMPIYLEQAVTNAKDNYSEANGQPDLYSTEVYLLGEKILPYVKDVLDKLIGQLP